MFRFYRERYPSQQVVEFFKRLVNCKGLFSVVDHLVWAPLKDPLRDLVGSSVSSLVYVEGLI